MRVGKMNELEEYLHKQSRLFLAMLGFVLAVLLALVDYLNPGIHLDFAYMLPIALVSWYGQRWGGVAMACGCACMWLVTGKQPLDTLATSAVNGLNFAMLLGSFAAFSLVVSALRRERVVNRHLALYDRGSGACTRNFFTELAGAEISRAQRYGRPFTLACVNFRYGEGAPPNLGCRNEGAVLRKIARAIRVNTRSSDVVGLQRDNEFVLLLPETDNESADIVLRKLYDRLAELLRKNEWGLLMGVGAVTFLRPPETVDELLEKAERLATRVREGGMGRTVHEVCTNPSLYA
ncbi:diguanylate cyclase domain-containing protein [Geobacter sp. AOG1]|uniref:GGDEF domain-containing protein n=1 Tax=Geobacter sp. AOG1 TaxID=1566346 RepID=UPI001CC60D3C|nr:diguanylate cyclase [Geobacter sp. AOG1]GFE59136.1 GGDEF domain-containing protein [Geobacter sp. AOG1]